MELTTSNVWMQVFCQASTLRRKKQNIHPCWIWSYDSQKVSVYNIMQNTTKLHQKCPQRRNRKSIQTRKKIDANLDNFYSIIFYRKCFYERSLHALNKSPEAKALSSRSEIKFKTNSNSISREYSDISLIFDISFDMEINIYIERIELTVFDLKRQSYLGSKVNGFNM